MNLLDWLLVLLVVAYALSGYWQGFVTGAFATIGLLLGGLFGIWLAPQALGDAAPSLWVSLGALFIVILSATIGQAMLQYAGAKVRDKITWQPARAVDAVGGAALSALAVLLVAWALGVAVSGSRIGPITPQVRNSAVLAKVNEALPTSAGQALQAFNTVVGTSFFPRYLEPFAREQIAPVGPPPRRIASDPDVVDAEASVLKIHGDNTCGRGVEGTGFLISDDRLMTNAHVVAGVYDPEVLVGDDEVDARVVYYNPDLDVAVLAVDGVDRPHLSFDLDRDVRRRRQRCWATPRTARTTCSRCGSAPSSGCAPPTSTARARCCARSTRCAAPSGPATPAARWSPPRARSPAWSSRRRSPTPTPATP